MLKQISEFPYGAAKPSNPIHEKLLLLENVIPIGRSFSIGYYDAVMDVFHVWACPGYIQTANSDYNEADIEGTGMHCVLPNQFMLTKGSRCFRGFRPLYDLLTEIHARGIGRTDINELLENTKYCIPYLIELNDGSVLVSETSCFAEKGNRFSAFSPSRINGNAYHSSGPVPKNSVLYATCLEYLAYT